MLLLINSRKDVINLLMYNCYDLLCIYKNNKGEQ
jgi:hypothetical protein